MSQTILDRIEQINPRLVKMAASFAASTFQDADDLYQSMIVRLLERADSDPSFAEQNDSYLLDAGRKAVCYPALRRAQLEARYTYGEPEDDGDENFWDTVAGPGVNPETAVIKIEQAAEMAAIIRERLSGKEREVLGLVIKGVSPSEIATALHISRQAVSVFKSRAAAKLQAVA